MIFKYKKHWFEKITDETIELPDDTVFIYEDNDVGPCLDKGCNHYLAGTKSEVKIKSKFGLRIYKQFPGVTFILFNNIMIESNIQIISGEEFYKKFELDTYYIFKSTKENSKIEFCEDGIHIVECDPSKQLSVTKILSIDGPYRINTFVAHVNHWLGDRQFLSINSNDLVSLDDITNDLHWNVEIKRNCEEEFIKYVNKTLKLINYKAVYDQPSAKGSK